MATYQITPDNDNRVFSIVGLSKEIEGTEEFLNVNVIYETGTWEGELTTEQVDAIGDTNDAWTFEANVSEEPGTPDDVQADDPSDTPTGFVPASYPGLTATLGDVVSTNIKGSLGLDSETMDGLEAVYDSLGLAGLENAGWTASDPDIVVQSEVTLTDITEQ